MLIRYISTLEYYVSGIMHFAIVLEGLSQYIIYEYADWMPWSSAGIVHFAIVLEGSVPLYIMYKYADWMPHSHEVLHLSAGWMMPLLWDMLGLHAVTQV